MSELEEERPIDWIDEALSRGEGFKSDEERKAYFDELGDPLDHPLWGEPEDLIGHPMLEAFRQIREEDKNFFELATMYKNEGNEWLKGALSKKKQSEKTKSFNEAIGCYAHALTFLKDAEKELEKYDQLEIDLLKSQILSNKAQVSLKQKNYGECKKDCRLSIRFHKENTKAWYRLIYSHISLKNYQECLDNVTQALITLQKDDNSNDFIGKDDILKLKKQAEDGLLMINKRKEIKQKQEEEIEKKWRRSWQCMQAIGMSAGYPFGMNLRQLDIENSYPKVLRCEDSTEVGIIDAMEPDGGGFKYDIAIYISMVVLYPQHNQFDIIQEVSVSDTLYQHLDVMFSERVSWDNHSNQPEYTPNQLCCYACCHFTPMIKDEKEWLEACRLRRDASGVRGENEAVDATQILQTKMDQHLKDINLSTPLPGNVFAIEEEEEKEEEKNSITGNKSISKSQNRNSSASPEASSFINSARQYGKHWLQIDPDIHFDQIVDSSSSFQYVSPGGMMIVLAFPKHTESHRLFRKGIEDDGGRIMVMNNEK